MTFSCKLGDRITNVEHVAASDLLFHRLEELRGNGLQLWIADENTAGYLPNNGDARCILQAGERHKHLETVETVIDRALSIGAGRDLRIIALGGGVVCDIAAFAASVYMRGVGLVLIPSTLLSMVDASLGGKCGVDHKSFKNIVGSFYPAQRVYICPELLRSLPFREVMNGLGEVVKHAMLGGDEDLTFIEEHVSALRDRDAELLSALIHRNLLCKKSYIEADPYEKGVRAHLNLGHTFAHALETVSGLSEWSHGEAVAWGLLRAVHASLLLKKADMAYYNRIADLLKALGYTTEVRSDVSALAAAMDNDKKKSAGAVRFVLQEGAGKTFLSTLPAEVLNECLSAGVVSV